MLNNISPFFVFALIFILKILYCPTTCILFYFYVIWFCIYTFYGIVLVVYLNSATLL